MNFIWDILASVGRAALTLLGVGAMFLALAAIVGLADQAGQQHKAERHNCLKDATNGLEIERCR